MVCPLSVITGGVTSLTVTLKVQLFVFPAASVAVAVTVVVPTGNTDPDAGLLTIVGTPQLSAPETVKFTTAEQVPTGALTVMSGGHEMVGSSSSVTVTVKLQLGPAELVQVTVVSPTPKNDPEG
jgi:hypothetical protein